LETKPMDIDRWVDVASLESVLDVGCNVGGLLGLVRSRNSRVRAAGVELNATAAEMARRQLPECEIHNCSADKLPFADASFDCVTCIEVLEHVPADRRSAVVAEIRRVLKPGGAFILQVPHAGAFDWMDPSNFRFRLPGLYAKLVRRGLRDLHLAASDAVVWHHHFSLDELRGLVEGIFEIERVHRGGLFLIPLSDLARWPFYRLGKSDGRVLDWLSRLAAWELQRDYGPRAYDIRVLLRSPPEPSSLSPRSVDVQLAAG
jgi:SAM-dependent methyltransferase